MFNVVADLLLPPAGLAILAFLVLVVAGRRARRPAAALTGVLLLLGVPLVGNALLITLAAPPDPPGPDPAAIVILSADAVLLENGEDLQPGPLTLDRLRAGAALQRRTGLPVLVSGGRIDTHMSLAAMMTESLREDFRLPVRWQEDRSRTTWENAAESAALLREAGITRIYLVTHFWHMRRAVLAFRAFGLDPVQAPVRPPYWPPLSWRQIVVRPASWFSSYLALHEWVGLAYYGLKR